MPAFPSRRYTRGSSPVPHHRADVCELPRCGRRVEHWGAVTCAAHSRRLQRNGHPQATSVTERELREHRERVARGLRIYRNTPAVREALRRAEELLAFTPTEGASWEHYLAGRMRALRGKAGRPVGAPEVLARIVELFAFAELHPERLPSVDAHRIALARSVVRMSRGARGQHPRKADLVGTGRHLAATLGAFAVLFLRHLAEHETRERRRNERGRRALTDFTLPPEHESEPHDETKSASGATAAHLPLADP